MPAAISDAWLLAIEVGTIPSHDEVRIPSNLANTGQNVQPSREVRIQRRESRQVAQDRSALSDQIRAHLIDFSDVVGELVALKGNLEFVRSLYTHPFAGRRPEK